MFQYNNLIVAGINSQEEFANWLQNGRPETGYYFKRKLDNFKMGHYIFLGKDWSEVHYGLASKPRVDLPEYYIEVNKIDDIDVVDELIENNEEKVTA